MWSWHPLQREWGHICLVPKAPVHGGGVQRRLAKRSLELSLHTHTHTCITRILHLPRTHHTHDTHTHTTDTPLHIDTHSHITYTTHTSHTHTKHIHMNLNTRSQDTRSIHESQFCFCTLVMNKAKVKPRTQFPSQ